MSDWAHLQEVLMKKPGNYFILNIAIKKAALLRAAFINAN